MRSGTDVLKSVGLLRRVRVAMLFLACAALSPRTVGETTLLHAWPGEGDANDLVGSADGVAIGALRFDAGRVGLAFRLTDGAAIALPAPAGQGINRDFTISLWCRSASPVAAAIVQKGSACAGGEWFRMESRPDGDLLCSVSDDETGTVALLTRAADLFDGAWHHLAWRREGGAQSVFVDGCLLVSPTSSEVGFLAIAAPLTLGGAWCLPNGAAGSPFDGWLDEVRWYAGALADGQIRQLASVPVAADLTGDGTVDAADLSGMLASWGPCGVCCSADLDASGEIDAADLGLLLAAWTIEC